MDQDQGIWQRIPSHGVLWKRQVQKLRRRDYIMKRTDQMIEKFAADSASQTPSGCSHLEQRSVDLAFIPIFTTR